ncbi:MAG: hypothetical protein EPO55_03310 [Reyranella sp.]|uniref:hypothetical protein n=1 Tax=Reyranella sp. TaxID=1929291 RepID=UPI00120A7BC7|nr:hypothetical protein [Reyranella sp.]TAJ42071.1 MAG: hypothetical protein EPO55_03310 [Reyranella sp.]
MDESSLPHVDGDLAVACFGDGQVSAAQSRLIRSALDRLGAAASDAANMPPGLIEQALAATVGCRPRPVVRPWMRLAAGVVVLSATGLLALHVLRDSAESEFAAPPFVETPAGRPPNVSLASREAQAESHVRAASEPVTYVRLSPELKRALRAYLTDPSTAPAVLNALGPLAGRVHHVRLDDRLAVLLRENRPLAGIRVEAEEGGGLLLLPPGRAP